MRGLRSSQLNRWLATRWWVRSRETITSDLPIVADLLKDEEFLIGFWLTLAGCVDLDHSRGIGASEGPIGCDLLNFSNGKLYRQVDSLKNILICLANGSAAHTRWKTLRHENPVRSIQLHHGVDVGLI